jgi:hypothetical protein
MTDVSTGGGVLSGLLAPLESVDLSAFVELVPPDGLLTMSEIVVLALLRF